METGLIFEPYSLNGLALNNRIVMAPMTRSRSANPGNVATTLTALYYKQRATAGLIITEGTFISEDAVGVVNVPGIYSKEQIQGWKLTTDAVHGEGGKIFAQLWHTGAYSHPDLHAGRKPLAPSAVNPEQQIFTAKGFQPSQAPEPMNTEDIKRTVNDFKQAAINAFEAGFDGVELHGANGYLLQQFFSKNSNHRTDEYGGSVENRARILFDILDELEQVVDIKKVAVRLNPSLNGIMGILVDDETKSLYNYVVNKLNDYGLAYIHLIEPFTDVSAIPDAIQEVAKHFRKIYKGTIIINRAFTRETANQVLNDGDANLVSFGVPFIANPDLVARFRTQAILNQPDQTTFYTPGEKGYTDYPTLDTSK
ncbi:alkene reductase [Pedobacter antarcticus]|uniref:NADH:flavin oxidoreductase n=2 Tax=Pedobacter antarcticus TaxID=34086 RepID=A0A081PIU8_9SPHI|nr:alkene reductase [Pedobacter antarcticus]KEQ30621.1 NADH:flavin oxidoreductase [Pedobacter antarcticus 4BY]SDM30040.1 N-ethylmaleimide reductase [Pedobacter antarcticus]SFF19230.1 N-ethylmaleimide reductase [Pedobacter antarcticus]